MGVYEDIRKSTYTKPQGVYARIHANDKKETPKGEKAKSVEPSIDMSKYTPEEQQLSTINNAEIKADTNVRFESGKNLNTLGSKVANFFKETIPNAVDEAWDNIKEPFVGKSDTQLLREAKLSPELLKKDAEIQLAKEDPTWREYALVKPTKDIVEKYGMGDSKIKAISGDNTQLLEDLKSAEKTWQASPIDATGANALAAGSSIFGNLASFANSIGADKVPLLNQVTNFAVEGARKAQENAQQYNRGNYGEALGTVTQGVVNLVPYFIVGTGTTAVKGATAVTKYAKYIEPIIKNPSFWYSLTNMWGQKYQEKLDEGYNRFQALGNAILYALPSAMVEVSGGIGASGKQSQSLIRTIGEEIGEELFQDIISGTSDKIATNHDLPVFSMTEDAIVNPNKMLKTALYTAPIVAIGGGANRAIANMQNSKIKQAEIQKDIKDYKQNSQYGKYIPQTQDQNIKLPTSQENVARRLPTNGFQTLTNEITLPTQKIQETVNSAKIAGMSDFDVKKATDLHKMLQSGTNLKFYDSKNVTAGVDSRAINANGFYKDGTLWINKDSKRQVEKILGHELTHHLENTKVYTDFANAILDSNMFYDYITTQGYDNVAQFKENLRQRGYSDQEMDSEMVSMFVEDNLFDSQEKIDRLARENRTLAQKILNWLSDMKTRLVGTSQEKELLRIENMYRKALEQAGNTVGTSTEAQYSIAGVKAKENINDTKLTNAYNEAKFTNQNTKPWFKDKEGNWKFEFSDKDMTLKGNLKLADTGNKLGDILEHDLLFRAYPELRDTVVNFKYFKNGSGFFDKRDGEITLNKKLFEAEDWKTKVEASLIHEIQHAIQEIEGYSGAANPFWSKEAYYKALGEIEASDTKERFVKEKAGELDRDVTKPRTSEPNPKHRMYDKYMSRRGTIDKIKDTIFPYYGGEGGKGYEISEEDNLENNKANLRKNDNRALRRYVNETAGKEPAFSMPKNPIEVAKNPPNPQSGLDALKRAGREKVGDSQSSFMRNIHNQSIFDDTFKEMAWDDKNIRTYESISNKETMQQANDAINEQGQKWVDRFKDKNGGEMKAVDIAGGFILMNRYQQVGDYESMLRIAEKLREAGTRQGQTIQLFSILGRMTPEGMTYYAQKELSKAYDEILKNKTQAWADEHADEFKLTEKDIDFIQRRVNQAAKLPEGRDKYVLLGEIASRIQSKIPPQPGQSLKALARNSMLLNPKTMVRNVLGNVVIAPAHIVSDFVGAGIDKAISNKTGTRTTGAFDIKSLKGAKKGFYESFDDFRRGISTRELSGDRFEIGQGGKNFSENHTGIFATPRDALGKALNALDRVTGYLLESGDRPFYETWFINSLNNQMELNNAVKPTAEMIQIATEEALQRTWQDNNTYTNFVSSIRNGLNKLNIKGYGLGDVVMPFVKTPANLTKAVVDFSPLGAINAALKTSQFNKDIGKGKATMAQQREVVKAWSQVITGTLGMAIATTLAEAGVLGGGSDEDKDARAFEQNILGIKPYSIKIGDKTYTYDWAQPLGTSAAIVADTVKSLKNSKDTESKVAAVLNGLQSGASVLLDQSFVSGIRNFFEEDNLINALIEAGLNEGAKFTPQFLSQIAQIQDDTARTSYVYNNPLETAKNKIKAKIPGLRETLEPSVDVLGREVKTDNSVANVMFNPANTAFARTTKGAEEMYRVYQATGDKATIAQVAPYYFNVGSDKIVLTPQQRTQYQKTTGKIASDGVENLLKNNAYKSLEDVDKAEILKDLYSYGNAIAKAEASDKYTIPKEYQKIKDSGMQPEEYILMKYIANSGGTKKEELYNALTSSGYSKSKAEDFLEDYKGYKFDNTSKNMLPTASMLRSKLPSLKK